MNSKPVDQARSQDTSIPARGLSASRYAHTKQELVDVINNLRSNGAYLDVDLPSIVVTGNQSSGKSSLIEAISAIELPRAEGACTRMPIELRLRRAVDQIWQCVVKIRREVPSLESRQKQSAAPGEIVEQPAAGETLDEITESVERTFERQFGDTIYTPKDVCQRVRQAQWRGLCADADATDESFLTDMSTDATRSDSTAGFSLSVIVIEISGPDLTDLSLVDLPGAIANSSKRGEPVLIEQMVKSYISRECLILLVISGTEDFSNSLAVNWVRAADPLGERTIGVLTKVDGLKSVRANMWLEVVKGVREHERLQHGYFLTRQPDADQRLGGISFEQARASEASLFESQNPWKGMSPALRERAGTANLVKYLSDQLVHHIKNRLPHLQTEIAANVAQTLDKLAQFPAPSNDPQREILDLIDRYTRELQQSTEGAKGSELFWRKVNDELGSFKSRVWATAPRFTPHTQSEIDKQRVGHERARKAASRKGSPEAETARHAAGATQPVRQQGGEVGIPRVPQRLLSEPLKDIEDVADAKMGPSGAKGPVYTLSKIREAIDSARTRELPNEVPPQVKTGLIIASIEEWEKIVEELLLAVKPIVEDLLRGWTATFFRPYEAGLLYGSVNKIIARQMSQLDGTTGRQLQKIVRLELKPFTVNDHYLDNLTVKYVKQYEDEREDALASTRGERDDDEQHVEAKKKLAEALAGLGMSHLTLNDLVPGRYTESYSREIQLMAEVRAYWQVAFKRIIDNAPRVIIDELTEPLATGMKAALHNQLGVLGKGAYQLCEAYVKQGPQVEQQREFLRQKLHRLEQAGDMLARLLEA